MSKYNEEDKRIGYWKLETVPDHIDRIRRMRRDKKKERQEDRRRDERK